MLYSRSICLAACVCLFIGIQFPVASFLQLASVSSYGWSWEKATGTVWDYTISEFQIRDTRAGQLDGTTSFLSLMSGKAETAFEVRDGPFDGHGIASRNIGGAVNLHGTTVRVDLAALNFRDVFDQEMRGDFRVDIDAFEWTRDGCVSADLTLWTDSLFHTARRYGGEGFPIAGQGTCVDSELVLEVAGAGASENIEMRVRISADLNYFAEVSVRSDRPELEQALKLYGFDTINGRLVMIQRGNVRGHL